jgi:hypothetical protein
MRVLVDENIPRMTVEGLRALGHDVKDIRGTSSVMHVIEHFSEEEWPNLLVVVRDTTMSTSRAGGDRG